jgi:hypothetical protein
MQAKAKIAKITPPYRSTLEAEWAAVGPAVIAETTGQPVAFTLYEPLTFHLPGGSYTPDFLHILQDGEQCFVEVKALIIGKNGENNSRSQRGYRDARAKLRAAADVYPFYTWFEVRIARHTYDLERIA